MANLKTPITLLAALLLVMLLLYQALHSREESRIHKAAQTAAVNALNIIESDIDKRIRSLQRLVARWEIRGGTPKHEFEEDAQAYITDSPGYQAIEWVDKSFHIRWIVPLAGNEQALGLDLGFEEKRRTALEQARSQKRPTLSVPITLVQGGKGLLVYVPIFIEDQFEGFILAVFRTDDWLTGLLYQDNKQQVGFIHNIFLEQIPMLEDISWPQTVSQQPHTQHKGAANTQILGQYLHIESIPNQQFLERSHTLLPEIILLAGIVLSLLIAAIVYLFQKEQFAAKHSLSINRTLENEVTHRKNTESLLLKERQRLAYILEGTNVGTWEWNVQTGETVFNERWGNIIGYTLKELEPISIETWGKFVHPDDAKLSGELLEKHFNKELDYYECEARMQHKNGSWVWVLDRGCVAEWDEHGKPLYMSGTHQEITVRKEIQLATERAKTAAESLAESKSNFLASMSHEIRTPMNGIIGLSKLALNQAMSDCVRDYLVKITKSSQSLLGVLNDILDFSKLEGGHMTVEQLPFSLTGVLENLHHLFDEPALAKSISFSILVEPDVPIQLEGDALRLQQILSNLISNAIKFTEQGEVRLVIKRYQTSNSHTNIAHLLFSITDTGFGMTPKDIESLFKPFQQVDSSITRRFGGTGLGLVISHELLALMDSQFKVTSEPNKGTCFTFELKLPVATSSPVHSSNKHHQKEGALSHQLKQSAGALNGRHILVVEDNTINQLVVSELLELAGVNVTLANHGQEALDKIEEHDFDGILMDMLMPIMGGLEATKHIRNNPKHKDLPIIALTAGVTKEERQKCFEYGMNDFIAKPVDERLMIKILVKQLNQNKS